MVTYSKEGVEKGREEYEKLKKDSEYNLNEGEMNRTGYGLLQSGKIKEAIDVFEINVTEFPKSANTYDSLGEAYLADGQKELALKNYKKTVEMDPKNENAIKIIEGLESN